MSSTQVNPFHFGKAVSGRDFCPRPQLEAALREKMRAGQNTLVQGDRRVGKTSLIRHVAQNVSGYTEVYVDLFGVRSTEAVVKRFANAVAGVAPTSRWGTAVGKALSFVSVSFTKGGFSLSFHSPEKFTPGVLDEVFTLLKASHQGKWIVVVDEFQEVLKIAPESEQTALIAQLRSSVQFLTKTPVVFAGSTRNLMHGIFNHPQSPFFKAAVTVDVGPLDRDEFSDWICGRFTMGGRRVNRETLEQIFTLASDVPGDVQQFCAAIWDVTAPGQTFTDLPRAMERIWEQEQRSNEEIVGGATAFQLRCLLTLALDPGLTPSSGDFIAKLGPGAQGSSALKACEKFAVDGVLMRNGTRFVFVNPYFREWLKMRLAGPGLTAASGS